MGGWSPGEREGGERERGEREEGNKEGRGKKGRRRRTSRYVRLVSFPGLSTMQFLLLAAFKTREGRPAWPLRII